MQRNYPREIDYYFDFFSPYSYFTWWEIRKKHGDFWQDSEKIRLIPRPVPLGRLLQHFGQKGPGEIFSKRNYLYKQCLRYALRNGIPFNTPEELPFNSLPALRLALSEVSGDLQWPLIDKIWIAGWEKGADLGDPEILKELVLSLGERGDEIWEKAFLPQARKSLKENGRLAVSQGVFGVPSFYVLALPSQSSPPNGELFWGYDSLSDLKASLLGKDPIGPSDLARFCHKHPMADPSELT